MAPPAIRRSARIISSRAVQMDQYGVTRKSIGSLKRSVRCDRSARSTHTDPVTQRLRGLPECVGRVRPKRTNEGELSLRQGSANLAGLFRFSRLLDLAGDLVGIEIVADL